MGYNKENFKSIKAEYETKAIRAQEDADLRRAELYGVIPELQALDRHLSGFGLRIMQAALKRENTKEQIEALRRENEAIREKRAALLRANGYPADYSDPRYECEKCSDSGYVGIQMCSCMRSRIVEAGMRSSGLSGLMKKQSFDNFSLDYYQAKPEELRVMKHNYQMAKQYAESFSTEGEEMPKSLLLLGGTGLGKTHLSTAMARVILERGYDVFYNSSIGMLSDFEAKRFGNGLAESAGDDTARYTECDFLIIDDLGTEVVNQFTLSCLYHVINTRLNLEKPTLISTNLTFGELRKTYTDRITSRLMGEYLLLPFYGTDVRKQKIQG